MRAKRHPPREEEESKYLHSQYILINHNLFHDILKKQSLHLDYRHISGGHASLICPWTA